MYSVLQYRRHMILYLRRSVVRRSSVWFFLNPSSHATIAFHLICIDENAIRSLRFKYELDETPSLPALPPPLSPRDTHSLSLGMFVCVYTYIIPCLSIWIYRLRTTHQRQSTINAVVGVVCVHIAFRLRCCFLGFFVCIKKQHEWMAWLLFFYFSLVSV